MKRIIRNGKISAATLAILTTLSLPAMAQNINVTVDGDVVPFSGQPPVQRFGTVLVPLRGVFEKLGASVMYDGATQMIMANRGATTVSLKIGGTQATVNGQPQTLALPAQAVNGTTLVPLRFVSEALGAQVQWSAASRTVIISTTGLANNPTAPPTSTQPGELEVTSLAHSGDNALRAGEVLTVTMVGSPGAQAWFTIPGIETAKSVSMKEQSPGTYVGNFTLPNGVNVKGATVLGGLKKNGQSSPTLQAARALTIDTVGPTLGNLAPASGAALPPGKPLVYGTFSDAGTGINTENTKLLLNGKDVTAQSTITEAFFSYRPENDLPMGKNVVTLVARDDAGNETRKEWGFTISAAESLVQELTYSPNDKSLEPGDVVTVRLKAKPGGRARFSIGGSVKDHAMREESAGNYVGSYTVRKGDSLSQAPITATFVLNGRTVIQTADNPVTIAAGAPDKPTILSPEAGKAAGDTVTIVGKAAPGATVRYHLKYRGTILVLSANGTVADGEVKADDKGMWKVENIRLSAPQGVRNLVYSIEAETVGAAGETSESASIEFKK